MNDSQLVFQIHSALLLSMESQLDTLAVGCTTAQCHSRTSRTDSVPYIKSMSGSVQLSIAPE